MEALLIQAHIQHHNDIADDLPKGQGDNSQVVPLQAQHRHPYQHAPQGPCDAAHQDGGNQTQAGSRLWQSHGGDDAGTHRRQDQPQLLWFRLR